MNSTMFKYLLGVLFAIALFGSGYFTGNSRCDAGYKTAALKAEQEAAQQGVEIQRQENKAAEVTRQAKQAEEARIDAIKTHDHATAEIRRLEQLLQTARENAPGDGVPQDNPAAEYRIFIPDAIERVWNESSGNTGAALQPAGTIQTRLSAATVGAGDTWQTCGQWRRLVCTNQDGCWQIQRVQHRVQLSMAPM